MEFEKIDKIKIKETSNIDRETVCVTPQLKDRIHSIKRSSEIMKKKFNELHRRELERVVELFEAKLANDLTKS